MMSFVFLLSLMIVRSNACFTILTAPSQQSKFSSYALSHMISPPPEVEDDNGHHEFVCHPCQRTTGRRYFLLSSFFSTAPVIAASLFWPDVVPAAETVGKDPSCNDPGCLGVWDGLLADCPHNMNRLGAGCVSSQDDTPGIFAEPWDYSEQEVVLDDPEYIMKNLIAGIEKIANKRGDEVRFVLREARYLRVIFTDGKTDEKSIGEFYITPSDTTIQFRLNSLGQSSLASFRNMERAEAVRKELRYLKLPVLRNRKRSLVFVESDLDTFGPGSAALGPPAEMTTGELEGRQDVDPKLKIDWTQQFPFQQQFN